MSEPAQLLAAAGVTGHALTPEAIGKLYAVALRQQGALEGSPFDAAQLDGAHAAVQDALRWLQTRS